MELSSGRHASGKRGEHKCALGLTSRIRLNRPVSPQCGFRGMAITVPNYDRKLIGISSEH
jgi:hypothetical protein